MNCRCNRLCACSDSRNSQLGNVMTQTMCSTGTVNRRLRDDYFYWACLAAVACALAFQLLVPPIVGLSDNGDFAREIGYFRYGPVQRVPPVVQVYVAPTYSRQHGVRARDYEQFTSDFLFVAPAVWISRLTPSQILPITLVGVLHAGGMLAALGRLFFVTRRMRGHLLFWIASGVVLTDVGYAAYANSFFGEAAAGIFAVWTIAETARACERGQAGWIFAAPAALLICAKVQMAPLALPLALFQLCVTSRGVRFANYRPAPALLLIGIAMFLSVRERPKLETSYNMLFSAVLPESRDPRSDLQAFGMNPELVRYKGTLAWSPASGLYQEDVRLAMKQATPMRIAIFYATRPPRFWRHITTLFSVATQIRPEACGNFTMSAGRAPAARATQFSLWSTVHERWLGRVTKFLLFGLFAMLTAGAAMWRRWRFAPLMALLPALALTAFLTAAFGDANEPIKHQYVFNLLLDACLLFGLSCLSSRIGRVRIAQTNSRTPPTAMPTIRNGSSSSQTTG